MPAPARNLTHSVKRLYRRTNKIDAMEFKLKKSSNEYRPRPNHTEQELDEWIIQTFNKLYEKGRFNSQEFLTKDDFIQKALQVGVATKKLYFALENLLNKAKISEQKISSKDIWIFALYQTLRSIERQRYQQQHIYTTEAGKRHSEITIAHLNHLIPGWLDSSGKISKG